MLEKKIVKLFMVRSVNITQLINIKVHETWFAKFKRGEYMYIMASFTASETFNVTGMVQKVERPDMLILVSFDQNLRHFQLL